MLHCVYLKNGVSGEVCLFILSFYILQHSSMDFYSDKLNLCFLYCKLFAFTIPLFRTSALGGCTLTILMTERSLQLALEKRISQDSKLCHLNLICKIQQHCKTTSM